MCLVHQLRQSNHTVRSYCQKCDPIPQKSIIAVQSRCLSITGRNFLFNHCTLIKNVVLDTQYILQAQIVTSHLVLFLCQMTHGSGTNQFIHIAAYGCDGIFVNYMIPSMLRKITVTSIFRHGFQHFIRQNVFFHKLSIYIQHYSTLGLVSRDVLPVKCCEHGPPSIAIVHFSKFSIATNILFN